MHGISDSVEYCFECNSVEWENNEAIIGNAIFLSKNQIGIRDISDADFSLLTFIVVFTNSLSKLSFPIIITVVKFLVPIFPGKNPTTG
jgi:hypothetical protein